MNEPKELTTVDGPVRDVFDPQPCGALRPSLRWPGWACDGTNLLQVMPPTATLPSVVIRRDLLPCIDDVTAHFLAANPWRPFGGGDHLHLCVPTGEGRRHVG